MSDMNNIHILEGNPNEKDNVRVLVVKGEPGNDGTSPTVSVTKSGDTATITVTDSQGTTSTTISDGVSPTVSSSKTGKVTTIDITDETGTTTATINDGETYEVPTNSVIGWDSNDEIPNGYEDAGAMAVITDEYSTSTSDGYSCNYLNGKIITETGSNPNGDWIKFDDGTMIITQVYSTTITTSQWSAWGSCYSANLSTPPTFPISFISQPAVVKSVGNTGNNGWLYNLGSDTTTTSGALGVVRPTTAGSDTLWTVCVIAIGKWK